MDELTEIDVTGLETFANAFDPRRDLHVFVQYVRDRKVKRRYRDNGLPKADALRLAKLLSNPAAVDAINQTGDSEWLYVIDSLAEDLRFVDFDTKGEYAGYSSESRSYLDNYITFNAREYSRFIDLPLAEQEGRLLDLLLAERQEGASEFYSTSILGRLDRFSSRGCALGVIPTLDFTTIRRFLLEQLRTCRVGAWYSVASLLQRLEKQHRYFLIPKNPKPSKRRHEKQITRYGNFKESKARRGYEIDIPEDAPG